MPECSNQPLEIVRYTCGNCGRVHPALTVPQQLCPRCAPGAFSPEVTMPAPAIRAQGRRKKVKGHRLTLSEEVRGDLSRYAKEAGFEYRGILEKVVVDRDGEIGIGQAALIYHATLAYRFSVELERRISTRGDDLPLDEFGVAAEKALRCSRMAADALRELGAHMSVGMRPPEELGAPATSEKRVRSTRPIVVEAEVTDE